jgi:hypothetical protein
MKDEDLSHTEYLEVLPDPVSLIESMRSVGYTVEAAVADIVDNSISAQAKNIEIQYDASELPYVAILDDGMGMSPVEITDAMRHGSNPQNSREPKDLGRFGLGLKTASLSQCRKLVVVSKKDHITSARSWDLDFVALTQKWAVVIPSSVDLAKLPLFKTLDKMPSGTLVIWQELDKLIAGSALPQAEMTLKFQALESHLSLVFHRFTQKEGATDPILIKLNSRPISKRDPFLKSHTYGQPLEGQSIRHERGTVTITPYTLPPIAHLTPEEIATAGGLDGLKNSQGYYIYRARRLVIWGTWFRLVPREEFYKLSRIQVDIPNSFDDLWSLDIKKSTAFPPDLIRNRLKEITPHFANRSKETVTYKGKKSSINKSKPVWVRFEPKNNSFQYLLNRNHPVLIAATGNLEPAALKMLAMYLQMVEKSIPIDAIYADMCSDHSDRYEATLEECRDITKLLLEIPSLNITSVLAMEPLSLYPQYHKQLNLEFKK